VFQLIFFIFFYFDEQFLGQNDPENTRYYYLCMYVPTFSRNQKHAMKRKFEQKSLEQFSLSFEVGPDVSCDAS
jgi:hypothetical protein